MLEVADLTHRFGERVAVDGVSFSVDGGAIVGLVGRNGAGKTTTMRAIMGILQPLGGRILWAGHPVSTRDRATFGYMPEERGLYPQMRTLEQVTYFGRLHGLSKERALEAAHTWLDRLGLGGREADRLIALSHGNQQRVQLAVAVAHEPGLLVLDEPFAGLDPAAVDDLSGVLTDRSASGAAVLFSSHQLELVERLCDRVVIVDHGKLLAQGTLPELRASVTEHLRVRVEPRSDWAIGLADLGVRVDREDKGGVLLTLDPGADPQLVLKAAQAAGRVEHFAFESGTLADVYRKLVSE